MIDELLSYHGDELVDYSVTMVMLQGSLNSSVSKKKVMAKPNQFYSRKYCCFCSSNSNRLTHWKQVLELFKKENIEKYTKKLRKPSANDKVLTMIKNMIVSPHMICNDAAVEHEILAQRPVQHCRFHKFLWNSDHSVLENEIMKRTIEL